MRKKVLSMLAAIMLMLGVVISTACADTVMYVYTEDGKTLNVRSSERVENNVIGRLPFGAEVIVRATYNGWAEIRYPWVNNALNGYQVDYAYVQSRYLVSTKPGTTPTPAPEPSGSTIASMNAEFRSAVKVVPFTVVARPSRASGWVNLRWAPSLEAERIATCPQGKVLTVLAQLNNWYQVQDPVTGMIGFISRQYVSVQ